MPDTKKKRSSPAPNFSVHLNHQEELRACAYDLGYIAKTGPRVGEGSIQALLEGIATGEVVLHGKGRRVEGKGKASGSE